MTSNSKTSPCFICGKEFPNGNLPAHEKSCLDNIQSTDVQYTRENTDDSSTSSITAMVDTSTFSNHSTSSSDSYEKKYVRCYICGTDVPTYLQGIHEKNCKKSWETGLLNSICTPAKKSSSKGNLTNSLSRGTSRTDLRHNGPKKGLTKSKSSTNIHTTAKEETFVKEPKSGIKNQRTTPTSRSTVNISKSRSKQNITDSKPNWNRTKSLQDLPKENGSTHKSEKKSSVPQYVECQFCGKQYSSHSIVIHQRSCERTRHLQKNAGTEVEYKKKSKSLLDLVGTRKSTPTTRPSTASSARKPDASKGKTRPSTANPISRTMRSSGLSASMGNLPITLGKNTADQVDGKVVSVDIETNSSKPSLSPGLQKCYICGQLYGTRSLPIHEKQCYKKFEREKIEEEKKAKEKKKPRKEIKLIPFGRAKTPESTPGVSSKKSPVVKTPSQLFGIDSPLKTKNSPDEVEDKPAHNGNENNENTSSKPYERNLITRSLNNVNNAAENETKSEKTASKFASCVYCNRQFGQHSINIHEKSCRDRTQMEENAKNRINSLIDGKAMGLKVNSKSLGDITSLKTNGLSDDSHMLVKCDDCSRKFLSSDIEKHRVHCRITIL